MAERDDLGVTAAPSLAVEVREVLEAAERGLADAETIIESRTGPRSWVGSLVLNRVRRALAGDFEPNVQRDARTLGDRVRASQPSERNSARVPNQVVEQPTSEAGSRD